MDATKIDGSTFCRSALLVIAIGGSLAGCATRVPSGNPYRPIVPARLVAPTRPHPQIATASWYGAGFSGRRTASGEIFRQNGMTAASKTLPLGTVIRVTNVANGRSVTVRVNDRGPYVRGRAIDLSRGAAQRIGLTRQGVGTVQISRLDYATMESP